MIFVSGSGNQTYTGRVSVTKASLRPVPARFIGASLQPPSNTVCFRTYDVERDLHST